MDENHPLDVNRFLDPNRLLDPCFLYQLTPSLWEPKCSGRGIRFLPKSQDEVLNELSGIALHSSWRFSDNQGF
ncbi:hypothetical protein LIER_32018 [Lithospermum erythrorhizon]|uniref:Uncharacterized protein n=1 Tax=Lithospermum erythrorhizon TaxID=34254 RepID=A0AAV3RW75_LITER